MAGRPNIVCMGILNTKGEEIRFLAENVRSHGASVKIMDLSLGGSVEWADISLQDILKTIGARREDIFRESRQQAARSVGEAGARKMRELYERGEVDGVISWAGAMGTTVATRVMRALPIGFPKVMMSTVASSDVSGWLVHTDIYIMNPIAEQGINKITRMIVNTAAASLVGMSRARKKSFGGDKPLAAVSAYGTTYPTVKRCADFITGKGWDAIVIHQTGSGATMEDLIRSGQITALYDITTAEISNTMFRSPYGIKAEWEGERLTAAADVGIPQVVCPGGLDQFTLGPIETVPEYLLEDYRKGTRVSQAGCGRPYMHNPNVTTLSPTIQETERIARYLIQKLNKTKGPTLLFIPLRGWSAYDQARELATVERGWPRELGDGPVWWPDPENPAHSLRAAALWRVVRENLDGNNRNLDVIVCDMHLLDERFADLLNRCMGDMLDGAWRRGMYRELPGVLPQTAP
jgi:uncharacterized protein (UPF0261 family)